MARLKGKKLWQTVGSSALAVITFVGVAVGISALVKKADEDMQVIYPTYEVGGLTENGKYDDTKDSIYTKESFECQGLSVTPDFDCNVSYRIYFYNINEESKIKKRIAKTVASVADSVSCALIVYEKIFMRKCL